jgi:hypothetical protein
MCKQYTTFAKMWYMKYVALYIFIFNELGQISVPKFQVCFDFKCVLLFIVC